MKVKYFLRGLGMGIIFTTLLMMTVVGTKKETLTDEEIMTRASLLGMVRADEGLKPTETPVVTETPAVAETPAATEKPVETQPPEETKEPEYVTVTIKGGMWSKDVSKAMEAAGLVSSAEKFDEYLCDNGYASFISVGTFKIRVGADFQEIAEKITK